MMDPNRLWAKSARRNEEAGDWMLLPNHLAAAYDAAVQVLDATGDDQLSALGLDANRFHERFRHCVLLAAATHDLGKANDHFHGMLCRSMERAGKSQGVRHEWISVLLLERLKEWLLPAVHGDETDYAIVQWAVGGHHPAFKRTSPPDCQELRGEGNLIIVWPEHPDFHDCLRRIASLFSLSEPAIVSEPWRLSLIGEHKLCKRFEKWRRDALNVWGNLGSDERRFVAAVKLSLIAADVAGSALPRVSNEAERATWIADALANKPRPGELAEIVEKRLKAERISRNDPTVNLRDFQQAIGASTAEVTFARAGCGSGKTLAAYHWAASNHPTRRLYLCYPTTGTATEGFRDYLHNSDFDFNPRLFHGRAEVDMAMILEGEEEHSEVDAAARIESLDAWSTPVVSCTVDTVLGIVQNNRRGVYAWPALAGAAFVFDEIHAYDDRLFGALLRFLQNLPGVPVLLMTASLPQARLTALRDCLKRAKRLPINVLPGPTDIFPDLDDLENLPRYVREETPADVAVRVRQEIAGGGKVLWVSNTVDRAVAAADSISDLDPKIYHSRFRYCDRVDRHRDVVAAFKADNPEPVVACTTQVCEMSLDLAGVTLLVTELAPVPALIQRLGRLNRKAKSGAPPRPFIVVDVGDDHLPYSPADLQAAREWLDGLPAEKLSQRQLAETWEQHDAGHKPERIDSVWLDGGPETTVRELRAASKGITVLLPEDAKAVVAGKQSVISAAIPMSRPSREWRTWEVVQGAFVPPPDKIDYQPLRGAKWGNA